MNEPSVSKQFMAATWAARAPHARDMRAVPHSCVEIRKNDSDYSCHDRYTQLIFMLRMIMVELMRI